MRKVLVFIACFAFFVSPVISSEQESAYSNGFARLSYVKGNVFIQRAGDLGYEEGTVNLAVVEGDKLGTREGQAEIHFGKRNYLRIDSLTQIDFVTLPRKGNDLIKLHLISGNIYLRINFLEEEKSFEIHTPDASFYVLEEGLYRIDVLENKETALFVFEGAVEAAGEEGSLVVEGEQKLVVSSGYFSSDPVYFYGRLEDSFSQWNSSRDALYAQSASSKYLPPELEEYEVELANNGRWVYERPYGYVWVPRVYHNVWRPYYYGRWIWYSVIGWTWASYDPWGWCVHHYGRWHWRLGLGWYWIPTSIWGPAWVHWHWGHDYICWCPLSYYGYPTVIVNNRFYGRFYNRYYPANSRALVVIHKNQLQARHISRVALSRNKIVRGGKISLSARQPDIKPLINRASLRYKAAAKVLSRSHLRSVRKAYGSGKALSPSRLRSPSSKSFPLGTRRTALEGKGKSTLTKSRKISNSRIFSRIPKIYPSRSSLRKSQVSERTSSSFSGSRRSSSTIRTYPSRYASSSSRSRAISSSRKKSSFSSRSSRYSSGRASSSRTFSDRSKVKTNTLSRSSSRSALSSMPSLRKNSRSRSVSSGMSRVPKTSTFVSRGTSRKSYSSSPKRSSLSRSASSRSARISSSKSRSSRVTQSSSSSAKSSHSSGRSSSSRSSSSIKIKKR